MSDLLAVALGLFGLVVGATALWLAIVHGRRTEPTAIDDLTGLRTRHRFERDLAAHACRGPEPTAILMIEVGGTLSSASTGVFTGSDVHAGSDLVVRTVGAVLERQLRDRDVAYRFDGGGFTVLMSGSDRSAAVLVAERVRRAIEAAARPLGAEVTVAVGVAAGSAEQIPSLVARAERALRATRDGDADRAPNSV